MEKQLAKSKMVNAWTEFPILVSSPASNLQANPQGIMRGVSHDKQVGNDVISCLFLGAAFSEEAVLRELTSCDTH
jgi:hypothetical protein